MRILLSTVLFALLLAGCAPTPHIAYHSTAEASYQTEDTRTQMELVGEKTKRSGTRDVAVLIGTDEDALSYALLAPVESGATTYALENVMLERWVPFRQKKVQELLDGLNRTLSEWGEGESDEGTFYEFLHAPEQDVQWVSEDIVLWEPGVRLTASHVGAGSKGKLVLGPSSALNYTVELEGREEVIDLRNPLRDAQAQLESM